MSMSVSVPMPMSVAVLVRKVVGSVGGCALLRLRDRGRCLPTAFPAVARRIVCCRTTSSGCVLSGIGGRT